MPVMQECSQVNTKDKSCKENGCKRSAARQDCGSLLLSVRSSVASVHPFTFCIAQVCDVWVPWPDKESLWEARGARHGEPLLHRPLGGPNAFPEQRIAGPA